MSEQNRYRIDRNYKSRETEKWTGWWGPTPWRAKADTWQGAIKKWIARDWPAEEYTVVAETPPEDIKSGIIEIQFDPQHRFFLGAKIKATLVED